MNKETLMEVFDLPVSTRDLVLKYNLPVEEASIIKSALNKLPLVENDLKELLSWKDLILDELEEAENMGDASKILRQYGRG